MRDNPFLEATVGGMLAAVATRFPDREAIVATDTRISYAALYEGACRVARALLALGVGKDDKVALWLPNRPALAQSDSTALFLTDPWAPRHVRIVADVPRTPGPHGDKVQKGKLRELFLAETPGSGRRPEAGGA